MSRQISVVTTNAGPTAAIFRTRDRVGGDVNEQLAAGASRTDIIAAVGDAFVYCSGAGTVKMDVTNSGTEVLKVKQTPGEGFSLAPGAMKPCSHAGELRIGF
jgi:hypothetical protein